jgi:hypothetical protein
MEKQVIKAEVEKWLRAKGKSKGIFVLEKLNWERRGRDEAVVLTSKLLLERFFMPNELHLRIIVGEDKCSIGLVAVPSALSKVQKKAISEGFGQVFDGSPDNEAAIYEMPGLDCDAFANGCLVGEYLDQEIEGIDSIIVRVLSRHYDDYLRYIGPCHSQDDYGFHYVLDPEHPYIAEKNCFVYIVVKDNSRTHAVQLRIKDTDNYYGTRTLYPQVLPAILDELKKRLPLVHVNADPVEGATNAQSDAIRNITIHFSSEAGKEEAMTRLAEAWLVAIGRLPSLTSMQNQAHVVEASIS